MRRDRESENGVSELLITAAVRSAAELGVTRLSLNFAVFRAALERGERLGAGPVTRAWRALLVFASRWWQIESLYRFNAKFAPEWVPRFVCFPAHRDLPRVAVAALEAEAFLVWPELSPRPLLRRLIRVRHLA
jgi:lysyl-tRNA synthetase class 2